MKKIHTNRLGFLILAGIIFLLTACEEADKYLKVPLKGGTIEDVPNTKNASLEEAIPIDEYTYYEGLTVTADEDNWYSITLSADSIVITCDFVHGMGDINIDLVDKDGNILASSAGMANREVITYIVDVLETYYIRVYLQSGASNTYTLWWDDIISGSYVESQPEPDPVGPIENNHSLAAAAYINEYQYYRELTLTDMEEDWYAISTSADSLIITCDFVHEDGDINIELVDKTGTILAASTGFTGHEEIIYIAPEFDTYYIHVYLTSGTSNTYTLWWDDIQSGTYYYEPEEIPTGPIENNHSLSTAVLIAEYHYYRDLTVTDTMDDWYAISTSADSLVITCDFVSGNGDINIELQDQNGIVLATSEGVTDHEEIIYIAPTLGTYYIHVYLESGTNNAYTLWWDDIWQGE